MSGVNATWVAPGRPPGVSPTSRINTIQLGGTVLTEADLQKLLRQARFISYLVQADPRIGELWDAFAVAERLEK